MEERNNYSVGLYTLGCKVSQYETEAIAEGFLALGFRRLDFQEVCDVYVINTCTVTAESDRKSRQIIRRAISKNPRAIVCVVGCYSQLSPEAVAAIEGVSIVLGTEDKMSLPERALSILRSGACEKYVRTTDVDLAEFEPMTVRGAPRTRAYVKIEDGCESKCTYCAISKARGRVRSKAPKDVISEVRALSESGTREVVLVGIEIGSYGKDLGGGVTLASLIRELSRERCAERIRLGSLAPELMSDELISAICESGIVAPHFHLSIQSGSDAVLHRMKRRYTRERVLTVVKKIKEKIPRATFTTDLMVGFPMETEEDHCLSESIAEEIGLLDAHVFQYSRREGTPAATYDGQMPEPEKKSRSERLISLVERVRDRVLSDIVESGDELSAICESRCNNCFTGHTDTYVEVRFESELDLSGEIVSLIPVSHKDGIVYAKLK